MSVRIRLEAADVAELDAHEAALRQVLTVPAAGVDDDATWVSRGQTQPGRLRYLESVGVHTAAAAGPDGGPSPLAVAEDFKRGRDLLGEIGALRAADEDLERRPWFPLQPGDVVLMHLAADAHSPAYGETYLAVDGQTDIAGNAMLRTVSRTSNLDRRDEPDEPEYLLRYDDSEGQWVIDSRDLDDRLRRWLGVTSAVGRDRCEQAQAFAAGEIADIEDGRELTGWQEIDGRGWAPVFADDDQAVPAAEVLTPFYELWFEAGPGRLTVIRAGAIVHGRPATTTAAAAAKGA
jgi:hypothetical protein